MWFCFTCTVAFKSFNCDMKIVTPCYIVKALPFLRVPSGIVKTEQNIVDITVVEAHVG